MSPSAQSSANASKGDSAEDLFYFRDLLWLPALGPNRIEGPADHENE